MLRSFFIICVALLSFVQSIKIHEHMTRREILKTFQTDPDQLPEYEIVPIFHTFHKRDVESDSTASVKVNAFNRTMTFYFEPNDGIIAKNSTPVWTAEGDNASPLNVKYTLQLNPFANIGRAYHDLSNLSAIVVSHGEDGETLMQGVVHGDLAISPMPQRLNGIISREMRSLDDSLRNFGNVEGFRRTHHHVVYKRQEPNLNYTHRTPNADKKDLTFSNGRSKRNVPSIVYPEILIAVDYSLYAVIGENVEEAARYVLAFWNAVDLRYRLLIDLIIRINIAGIILSLDNGGIPYINDSRHGETMLDIDLAIVAMSHYFYNDSARFPFATYDLAFAMTKLDLANKINDNDYDGETLGYAYVMSACNRSSVDKNTEAVGLVEDSGGYSGIIPAAHELGHLLGLSHDGQDDAQSCSSFDGFIMQWSLDLGPNKFSWSNCSLKSFHTFFSSDDSSCLHNKPQAGFALNRILPGKIMTLDQQCQKLTGRPACPIDENTCIFLRCHIPGFDNDCRAVPPPAEGSNCGVGRHCINGLCVNENATYVPYQLSTTMRPWRPWRPRIFLQPQTGNIIDEPRNNDIEDES